MASSHETRRAVTSMGKRPLALFATGLFLAASSLSMQAQVSVTTWRNDIGRTGQNLNETILNTSDVNATQFGKLFSQPVDGFVYAQPLYLPNVTVAGQAHNVVFVATEHDSVYAFDADNNGGSNASPLWYVSMLSTAHGAAAGATTVSSDYVGTDIIPEVGITGTPVIDPVSGTLYVVSATMEGTHFFQRLHALDVTTGAEKFGGPINITATVAGTGNGSSGGTITFDNEWENQRPGLLLLNGILWIAFASHGDNGPWHGWVLGYNAQTLQQTGAFNASPNGVGSGIWMGGAGLAADVVDPVNHPYGRIFVPTGNGDYTATKPYSSTMDYGDSILNLDLTNGVPTIQDEFTPSNQANLDAFDGDQASGGLLVVPNQTSGSYPHLLVQAGKSGEVFLLNRENLGGYNTAGDQVLQELPYTVGNTGTWSMPAYWNGTVYYWGQLDTLKAFPLVNGKLTGPTAVSTEKYGYPGANPVISANGTTQGIVWTVDSEGYSNGANSVLQAHDASHVANTLYSSATNATRDAAGMAVKFAVPTVVNGKVYVGTQTQVSVYGLLNGQQLAANPVFNPGAQTFNGTLSVSMTAATTGSTIYYTLNGTTPTISSPVYSGPITITATTTIQAIASAAGYLQSAVTSATYVDVLQASTPAFDPGGGTFAQPLSVSLSDATSSATIYYSTDGSTPSATSTTSTKYTAPILVSATETLNAVAVASGFANSTVASATYTLNVGQTGINFPVGFAGTQGVMILNGSAGLDDSRLQLTNGGSGEAGSAWYYQAVNVQAFSTNFTFQLSNPAADGITFAIQGNTTAALGDAGSGLGYQGMANSLALKFDLYNNAGEGSDSIGLYTGGASPTVPAIDLSTSGIDLHSDDTMHVYLAYNGTILSMTIVDVVTGASYSTSWAVNIPATVGANTAFVGFTGGTGGLSSSQKMLTWIYTLGSTASPVSTTPSFSPPGGAYGTAQTVSMNSGSSGATIYYTTNSTTPTTASTVYSGPVVVSSAETLSAIAIAPGYGASAMGTAAYNIAPVLPAPTLSPAPGTYTTAQTVTISDSIAGTTIHYTTDGTTPTTSSATYTAPIALTGSQTVLALATGTGYNNSPIAGGNYTVAAALPAPTFSPVGGTYATTQTVTIADATPGTIIYYTTNGTVPLMTSNVYNGPITVSTSQTIEAMATETGYTTSPVASAAYTIGTGSTTYLSYPSGGITATKLSLNYGAAVTGGLLQLTDGGTGENRTAWFSTPVPVQSFVNDFTFQQLNAQADGMTFAIQSNNVWELGDAGGGLGYQEIPNSVAVKFDLYSNAGEGPDSTGLYTGGAAPTLPSVNLTPTGVNLHSGDIMHAHMVYDGTNLTMTLTDTVTNVTTTQVFPVNIPSVVGSNAAYVGFTGGTGGQSSTQNVLSWSFVSPAPAGQPTAATPTFSPGAGSYTTAQTVTINDTTPGAAIYYTTNGTTPTTGSTLYSGPVTVSASETLEAIAVATGYNNSGAYIAAYTINPVLPTPTFSPVAGTYTTAQTVTISDATAGTTIYYTVNGNLPTPSASRYTGPLTIASSLTLQAIATATGYTNSALASGVYNINPVLPTPTFTPVAGTYTTTQTVAIADATAGTTIYYTANGNPPTTSSTVYSGPITVSASQTVQAIAVETGYTTSAAGSAAYTIASVLPTPTFTPVAGTYTTAQTVTIADATAGTTIYYTTNGNPPTTGSTVYSGPVTVSASQTLQAIAVKTGFTNSLTGSAAYTISPVLPTPTFTPVAGTYTTTQTVAIADATAGTTIYYTANGNPPTTSSTVYSGPITVSASQTVQAIAVETGYTTSLTGSAAYTISPVLPTPTFTPVAGTYTTTQTVAIADATAGTTIYYTTNGNPPTTGSTLYSAPITVSTSQTVQAIAVKTGYTNSAAGSAIYTITPVLPAPVFTPAGGTYSTSQSVTISDATAGTTIYYTTNGNPPTTSSTPYTGPIAVSASQTVQAIAVETGYTTSAVGSAAYTISSVVPAPTFSPGGGAYTNNVTVTLASANPAATIYYTLDGSTPTTSSPKYTAPRLLHGGGTSGALVVNAIAVASGSTTSSMSSATYVFSVAKPVISPGAGTYGGGQTITITCSTTVAHIYYTTNGSTPTNSSTVYTAPFTMTTSGTLKAIGISTGYNSSPVASAAYTFGSGSTTYVNYASSGFNATNLALNYGAAVTAGGLLQLTDGGTGENRTAWFSTPVPIQTFTNDFTFQQLNPVADGITFAIQGNNTYALGDAGSGLGYQDIPNSVGVKFDLYNNGVVGAGTIGLYTGGAAPTTPSTDLGSTGINLHSGDVMHVHMVYDGTNLTMTLTDTVTNATTTQVFPVNIPSAVGGNSAYIGFTGGTGSLTSTQNILSWNYTSP